MKYLFIAIINEMRPIHISLLFSKAPIYTWIDEKSLT
jgi:hypothetical protein